LRLFEIKNEIYKAIFSRKLLLFCRMDRNFSKKMFLESELIFEFKEKSRKNLAKQETFVVSPGYQA